ncbi:MAG: zinc ribbon domain-containing protein [Candidatus Rokubacteria bacterium]|nr:zinc ribbon domain-containing protein [Candidatus Rokubacteria bacterium]
MPTYEYECSACGQLFEVRQRISDAALEHCIHCGASVHRVLAAAPFILKGSGFYVNDYPSESRKKGLTEEKKATADSGASSSTAASPTPSSPESSSSKP